MTEKFSIDGLAQVAGTIKHGCCPDTICSISKQSIVCGFVSLLPNGPLWDADKNLVMNNIKNKPCGSLADYAKHVSNQLYQLIYENLWPAFRESNPFTAVTTLDDWLDRLGWVDCYESCNRRKLSNELSPFEVMGYCGPIFCPPDFSDDYQVALKSAIVKSLYRLRLGIIPNLASINAVLEPLGVILEGKNQHGNPCELAQFDLILRPIKTQLVVPQKVCSQTPTYVSAYYDNSCQMNKPAGLPDYAWPTVMAAECIVRSIIWSKKLNLETQFCLDPKGIK